MNILKLFIILSLSLNMALLSFAAEEKPSKGEVTVGVITLSPPEPYVIAEDIKAKKKRLYKKSDYEKVRKDGLNFVDMVLIETIEYQYKVVEKKVEFVSEEFELVDIEDKKAVLKKEYVEKKEAAAQEPEETPLEEAAALEEVVKEPEEETAKEKPVQKRLVAKYFFQIESENIAEHEWAITLPTVFEAAANFGTVLGIVVKKLDELSEPGKKTKIYFNTAIGKGALSEEGLLIESLNSRLRAKCGIKDDDLIKSVNGRSITTIQGISSVFSSFAGAPMTVTVNLVRDEDDLVFTYYIK